MRSSHFLVLLALVPTASTTLAQDKGKAADDQKLLLGTWKAVALETNGRLSPEGSYSGTTITFEGDKIILLERGQPPAVMGIKLDPTRSPKTIDLILNDGPRKGDVLPGIYELKGDDLKFCMRLGKLRPTEFKTKPGDNTEMFTLKRLGETTWKRFAARDDGYSVELPGEPEARKRRDASLGIPIDLTIYVVRNDRDRLSYLATGHRLPGRLKNEREMQEALEAARDRLMAEFKGKLAVEKKLDVKLLSDKKVDFKPGLAREYMIQTSLGIDVRARIYVTENLLIILQVVGVNEVATSKNVERFLNSMQLDR